MKIAKNVFLKGLKRNNGFNLKPILAVLLPLILVFTFFYNVSAKEDSKNSPSAVLKEASVLDSLIHKKSIVMIRSCENNKVLDLPGSSKNENSLIIFYEANGGTNQLWSIEKVERGYTIRSLFSKKVLAITTEFSKENALVVQQEYNGKDNQIWLISGTPDSIRILNKAIQKYLSVSLNFIDTEDYSNSIGQEWKLVFLRDAQNETVSCDCPKNFEYIRNLMETSYSGFRDKVNPQTKSQYEQLQKLSVEKASNGNIDAFELLVKTYGKTDFLMSRIKRMKENPGKFLESASDGIVKFDAVFPNPRRIAILINKDCASSAEEFLLRAIESKKVVLLGQPTSGTLDYSNLIPGKFPCAAYNISYPFTRTRRLFLVDKEKIKPNVYLTGDQNWIEEAVKYLKRAR